MRTLLALVFLCGVTLSAKEGSVWFWQSGGSGTKIRLDVQLDQKAIFTTSFTAASTSRNAIPKTSYAKAIRFSFRPDRSIVWNGYRDQDMISPARQKVKCDIWMAGADENSVTLGVSFASSDAILMNTLHIALPTTEARSEIAHGLVVITTPSSETEPNPRMHRTPR